MNIPYYIRDVFSLNNYIVIKNTQKLKVSMSSRTIRYKMFSDFDKLFDYNKIDYVGGGNVTIYVNFNSDIKPDGYTLSINKQGKVVIEASNDRGTRYAFRVFNDLIEQRNNNIYLPIVNISDEPSFKLRGIIEGFYGEPWSHENKLDVIDFMNKYRMNAFMYAPKDDEYHRNKWRDLYPEEMLNKILQYKERCDSYNIDFYYCISPGKDFNYIDKNEFDSLFKKLDQVISNGIKNFALLLDDIDYKLEVRNKNIFTRPGIAHAHICNVIYDYLKENVIDLHMIMCPTEYHQNWDTQYRNDIKERMSKEIAVFFTGDSVCAEVIDSVAAKNIHKAYDHDLILWENYPVNDFLKPRIFLSPLMNRSSNLHNNVEGFVSNPMNQWHASKIGVITIGHYMWNSEKYNPELSFEVALRDLTNEDKYYESLKTFAKANYAGVLTNYRKIYHQELVENKDYEAISKHYKDLSDCAKYLKSLNNELIKEVNPWLDRAINEANIFESFKNNNLEKEDLINVLKEPYILGDELFDFIIKDTNILTEEEYNEYIVKPRGTCWWIVWEDGK